MPGLIEDYVLHDSALAIVTDKRLLNKTIQYLESLSAETIYPCHCTDLAAKIHLSSHVNIKEVGVGLSLNFSV